MRKYRLHDWEEQNPHEVYKPNPQPGDEVECSKGCCVYRFDGRRWEFIGMTHKRLTQIIMDYLKAQYKLGCDVLNIESPWDELAEQERELSMLRSKKSLEDELPLEEKP